GWLRPRRLARSPGPGPERRAPEARLGRVPARRARLGAGPRADAGRPGRVGAAGHLERGRARRQRAGLTQDSRKIDARLTQGLLFYRRILRGRDAHMTRMTRRQFL